MPDEERIEQLELEIKVLQDNNKGLKNKIDEQSKEIEELKLAFDNCFDECTSLRENFHKQIEISKNNDKKWEDKIKAKIEEKFLEAKGLHERGVQPQAQYTMKLLRDLEKSLLEKEE